ncbi:MAG TPA: hypothetical protein PK794_03035, partial [Armatimonadota bacterium]|nr:hypothetical protein [Armatimonadota bacterium]
LAAAVPGLACYSGLTVIPTADTVGAGQYGIELQADGPTSPFESDTHILNTEIGLGDRVEVGVDFDLSKGADPRVLFNGKYVFATGGDGALALAAGVQNIGNGLTAVPYLVGTRDFTACRGHLGVQRAEGNTRPFVGIDAPLGARWTLMADYTAGDENSASAGVNYQFTDRVGLLGGLIFPNDGSGTGFTVHLVFNGPYR